VSSAIVQETHYDPWGLELTGLGYQYGGIKANKYLYNGKELIEDNGLQYYDFGARMYDASIGRWSVVDPLAEKYNSLTPYQYGGNTPVNTVDIGGKLFIFVNGFMVNQWLVGVPPVNTFDKGILAYSQNNFYNPNRGFFMDFPRNGNDSFEYWDGVDFAYIDAYRDENAYYTNGSFSPKATASSRFNAGLNAGLDLIARLESNDITLEEGETIKIVGHSHGAAYAAGIVSTLIKHQRYGGLVEFVDYLSPHQPGKFKSPSGVSGRQFSTKSDKVSSVGWIPKLFGKSKYDKIDGTTWGVEREYYRGGFGGHMVDTWLDDLIKYWRDLGIQVNVRD
jgi:RHS repeat-associated protein